MTLRHFNLVIEGGILAALAVFGVWRFINSGRITQPSEVDALRAVLRRAGPAAKKNQRLRNRQIRTLQAMVVLFDTGLVPILLITAGLLADIAPLIDEGLAASSTAEHERTALIGFKERMIQKGIWPAHPTSQSTS
jgi:hypothetical protein